jgi:hypothetical protein
MNSYHSV